MFDSLLVPVDDTRESERVLPAAVAVARAAGVRIDLLTVDSPHADLGPMHLYQRHLLDELPAGVDGHSEILLGDEPVVEQLLEAYRSRPAAILALATRAPGSLWQWLGGGSVGDDLVTVSLRPVLLVGPSCDAGMAGKALDSRTLVALDGTALDDETFDAAVDWARVIGTPLTLVRVVDPDAPHERFIAEADLVRRASTARAHGLETTRVVIESFAPGEEILRLADDRGVLVVGSHRRAGIDRLLHGSNALWLTHRAKVPVLVAGFSLAVLPAAEEGLPRDLRHERGSRFEPCIADLFGWAKASDVHAGSEAVSPA